MTFFVETVMSGLLTGVMYSLVALGFVLIYKASGVFNFAQGVMALFAALTLTGLMNEYHLPVWAALPLTVAVMAGLAFAVEFAILRRLVNQEPIVLFMATLGLAYILEGLGDILWGPDVKVLDLGLPGGASGYLLDNFNIYIERIELVAAGTAAVLVAVLAVFFQHTRTGRALRAVADDHQA
ncbi:MAG: branched-chain amino acid ABC transporter permease, partial [Rhodoblastus sp.]